MNLNSVLENSASNYGNREAIVHGSRRLTYAYINEASQRFGSALVRSGLDKGDRVVLLLSNSPEFFIAFFGITRIGAVALPLDLQYKPGELRTILSQAQPAAVIFENTTAGAVEAVLSEYDSIQLVIEAGTERTGRFTGFDTFLSSGRPGRAAPPPLPEDTAVIMYTSFASFQPRGVMLSHESLVKESAMSSAGYRQTEHDIMMLFALPLFHVFGLVAVGLSSIYSGSKIVMVPGTGLSIGSFMDAIEREKGTMFLGVPYIFALAVDMAEREGIHNDLSSLRICASAGAPLSVSITARFKELYGFDILDCYGLTEAVCHVTCPPLSMAARPGTIGRPLPGWEIRIVDNSGNNLPSGKSGEILVAGPLMKGYYNNPEATREAVRDGWLYTGDIGMKDKDGCLYITGRKKETIIIKGQNVYPVDIESVVAAHPGVAEVAVMGIPDRMRGEIIGAVVSLREGMQVTEQEIRQLCAERIASYKVPKKILFTGRMPRNAEGEIDKESLRMRLSLPPVFPVL